MLRLFKYFPNYTIGNSWYIDNQTDDTFRLVVRNMSFVYESFWLPYIIPARQKIRLGSEYYRFKIVYESERETAKCLWIYQSMENSSRTVIFRSRSPKNLHKWAIISVDSDNFDVSPAEIEYQWENPVTFIIKESKR